MTATPAPAPGPAAGASATPAVLQAVLHLREVDGGATNWTRALCRGMAASNFDDAYQFTGQSMEPSVLFEVAREAGLPHDDLARLRYGAEGPMATVRWLHDNLAWAPHIQRINLAYCLASAVRYELAHEVLARVDPRRVRPAERYLYQVARFMIGNRLGIASDQEEAFSAIREYVEAGHVSDLRTLLAASFAIVWHDKAGSLSEELHGWFVERGLAIAARMAGASRFGEQLALSSFYRAYAMIPARRRDAAATRAAMERAEHHARAATPAGPVMEVMAKDAIKTVLESTLKEHLYLTRDLEAAERAGRELVALDPGWTISYHELAEVLTHAGRHAEALALYEQARALGLPRIAYSQYMIGQTLERLNRSEQALEAYRATLALDDTNISAGVCGHNLAKRIQHASLPSFTHLLTAWDTAGDLPRHVKEMIL